MTETLLLSRGEVESLLDLDSCFTAVEEGFRQYGTGEARRPGALGVPGHEGGFHIKAGIMNGIFAAKVNGNFFENENRGLPRIQGIIVVSDASTGAPLAILDSVAITKLRTAAATAVAAKYLARPASEIVTICGCGVQGRAQLRALARVLSIKTVFCYDEREERALAFARELGNELTLPIAVAHDLRSATLASDIVVTCTPSKKILLSPGFLKSGALVAAVGADSEEKQELDPALMAAATMVTDVTEQCAVFGDLHHALASGLVKREDVHGELGEIVSGRKPGRRSDEEILVFDSTGMALQDVAAASVVCRRARAEGRGIAVDLTA